MKRQSLLSITLSLIVTLSGAVSLQAQTSGGIRNSPALRNFFYALALTQVKRRSAPVRIVQYGDSHTSADQLTGTLRYYFQKDFGAPIRSPEGVDFRILGINGMRAVKLVGWSSRDYQRNVTDQAPDLIIVAYGTNEVVDQNWSLDSYEQMFAGILRRFHQAAPQASILVIAPPDRCLLTNQGWQPAPRMQTLIAAQYRAAMAEGAAFWSASEAMGGDGSMRAWVADHLGQNDHVHLTSKGYARLGTIFYTDFVLSYNQYVASLNRRTSR